jgi:ATP-dependent DNA ligase
VHGFALLVGGLCRYGSTSRDLREIGRLPVTPSRKLVRLADRRVVLDGKPIALEEGLWASFQLLAQRMRVEARPLRC